MLYLQIHLFVGFADVPSEQVEPPSLFRFRHCTCSYPAGGLSSTRVEFVESFLADKYKNIVALKYASAMVQTLAPDPDCRETK